MFEANKEVYLHAKYQAMKIYFSKRKKNSDSTFLMTWESLAHKPHMYSVLPTGTGSLCEVFRRPGYTGEM